MLLMLVLITACNVLPSENYKGCRGLSRGGGGGGGMPNASGDKRRPSEGLRRRGLSPNGSREGAAPFDLRASPAFPGEPREAGRRWPFVVPLGRGGSSVRLRRDAFVSALGDGHGRRGNLSCELGRLLQGLRRHGDSCHDSRRHSGSCGTSRCRGDASEAHRSRDRSPPLPRPHAGRPHALIDHSIRSDVSSALAPSPHAPHDHILPSAPCRPRGRPTEGPLPPVGVPPSPAESRGIASRCTEKRGSAFPRLPSGPVGAEAVGASGKREASVPSLA
ncbi:uncharacterized protein [Penaeus vannamei]|uniref:uncharacterized protein n=1 Tax=Penaeus vannamei TaxID=6689 RepID=UPI00387F55CC